MGGKPHNPQPAPNGAKRSWPHRSRPYVFRTLHRPPPPNFRLCLPLQ